MLRLTVIIILMVAAIFSLGKAGAVYLENYYPRLVKIPENAKGLILLGGSFQMENSSARGVICYNPRGGRIIEFMELAQKYPHLPLVFTGGATKGIPGRRSESDMARQLFENLRLDLSRVRFEDQSNNTFENATLTFKMVQPKPEDQWVLVTSAVHMPRSVSLFRAAGWNVIPYPVDYNTTGKIGEVLDFDIYSGFISWSHSVHEWGGLLNSRLKGVTRQLLPDK